MTPGYVEFSCGGGLVLASGSTGADTNYKEIEATLNTPAGYVKTVDISGNVVYMKESDVKQAEDGVISWQQLDAMYGL